MRQLSEKQDRETIDAWYVKAKAMTAAELPAFIAALQTEYGHDYGTICHAVAASAIAAANAMDKGPSGGITGFQAGAVFWEFARHWLGLKGPCKLTRFENLLYPQYAGEFKSIDAETWAWLQAEAKQLLADKDLPASGHAVKHWQSIVNGTVPFGLTVAKG